MTVAENFLECVQHAGADIPVDNTNSAEREYGEGGFGR